MMKAAVFYKYGKPSNVSIKEIETLKVEPNYVLVEVHSASINQANLYILQGKPFPLRFTTGLFKPKNNVLGSDFSGVVKEVGEGVTNYKVGDEVFGEQTFTGGGSYAEYVLVKPKQIAKKPKNVTHQIAASTPMASLTAIQAVKLADLKENQTVLIYGASGGVGTFLIQVAKAKGAHVTAVCSTRNIDIAKMSGADKIIDYKKEQWDKEHIQYDVIFAANGYNKLKRYRDALKPDGTLVTSGGSMKQIFSGMFKGFMRNKEDRKFLGFTAKVNKEDLHYIAELLESEQLKPYIDKEFPLEKTEEALTHFLENKNIGKTIINIK